MRKVFNKLFLALLLLFPTSVFAAGSISASPTSLTIEVGSSKTFTISAYNAIGDVSISSSNSGVASVSTGEWGTGMVDEGQNKTGIITVTGKSVGTATIILTIDAATFDGDDLAGQTRTVNVNVVAKPTPTPTPTNTPTPTLSLTPTPTPTPTTPSNNNNNSDNVQTKSTNNKIKELSIDGYELVKVDENNYTLSVGPNVKSINIKATAEDSKAKVTGAGEHKLQNGENNIEIIVTSESGSQNRINVKIIKKENYFLKDLNSLLNHSNITDIDITIDSNTKLTSIDVINIKNSGKKVKLNYYDDNKKLLYSWVLDGSKITEEKEFLTTLSDNSENTKAINSITNNSDGLFINTKNNNIPNGTKIRLFVGNKFNNNEKVRVFTYNKNSNKMDLVRDNLIVKDGYIEFNIDNGLDYFITKDFKANGTDTSTSKSKKSIFPILIFSLLSLIIVIIIILIIKKNSRNKKDKELNNYNNSYNNESQNNISNSDNNVINQNSINSSQNNISNSNNNVINQNSINSSQNFNNSNSNNSNI